MFKKLIPVLIMTFLIIDMLNAQVTHFRFASNTGNSATVLVKASINPKVMTGSLASGDEIGVFTPAGLCCGAVAWTGQNVVITVWGDNAYTGDPIKGDSIEGFRNGEKINFRIWLKSKNREYLNVTFSYASASLYKDNYASDGIYELATLVLPNKVQENTNPEEYNLNQNYPNPFNPSTKIEFTLESAQSSVQVIVFDLLGREVSTLVNQAMPAGKHSIDFKGDNLQSGTYYYKLQTKDYSSMKKMMLMK